MSNLIQNNLGEVGILTYSDGDKTITPQESNASEDNRVMYINYIRAMVRLKNLPRPIPGDTIYNALKSEMGKLDESQQGSASRLFEFIPVSTRVICDTTKKLASIKLRGKVNSEVGLTMNLDEFKEVFGRFSNIIKLTVDEYLLQSTLRTFINAGIPYSYIPYNQPSELIAFKSIILKAPYFALTRILEHTQLSKEIEYDKNITTEEYWYPETFTDVDIEELHNLPYRDIETFLKNKNISKDIYSGGLYSWRKRTMILSGWESKYTWKRLFIDKNAQTDEHSNFTPREISTVIRAIKDLLYPVN